MKNKDAYPVDWNDTIRPHILKKFAYKCAACKIPHRSHYYMRGKIVVRLEDNFMLAWAQENGLKVKQVFLNICHKDHDPSNNEERNLIAWCPRCHAAHDNEIRKIKRKAFPRTSSAEGKKKTAQAIAPPQIQAQN